MIRTMTIYIYKAFISPREVLDSNNLTGRRICTEFSHCHLYFFLCSDSFYRFMSAVFLGKNGTCFSSICTVQPKKQFRFVYALAHWHKLPSSSRFISWIQEVRNIFIFSVSNNSSLLKNPSLLCPHFTLCTWSGIPQTGTPKMRLPTLDTKMRLTSSSSYHAGQLFLELQRGIS
jgi:hypothetical protein